MGMILHQILLCMITLLATIFLVKSTCQFLRQHNIELHRNITLPPLWDKDQLLMLLFSRLSPSMDELEILNRCRLYLQVSFLSEISTEGELMITEVAWHGQWFDVPEKIFSLPQQRKTTPWEWLTSLSFLKRAVLSLGLRLKVPLGLW